MAFLGVNPKREPPVLRSWIQVGEPPAWHLTPSMRRPVGVKTFLFFLSVVPNLFTEPPLSPSFHPQSLLRDSRPNTAKSRKQTTKPR
jgi:hypothetical protein